MIGNLREALAILIEIGLLWVVGLGVVAVIVAGIELAMRVAHYLLGDRR